MEVRLWSIKAATAEINNNGLSEEALQQLAARLEEANNRLRSLEDTINTSRAAGGARAREEGLTVGERPPSRNGGRQSYLPEDFSRRLSRPDHLGVQKSVAPSSGGWG